MHFDRAPIGFVYNAVGNRNVFCYPSAKPENRPPGTKGTVAHCYKLAATKQSTRIILCLDITFTDMNIFTTDKMKPVIVMNNTTMNV
jgi:hypothetical protein